VEDEETYLEHCKKNADGAKSSRGWCDARDLFREVHGFDGRVQQRDGTPPILRSLGLGFHGSKLGVATRMGGVKVVRKISNSDIG
jgi:hypothetical protein